MAMQNYDGYEQILNEIKARVGRRFADYYKQNGSNPYDIKTPIDMLETRVVNDIENLRTEIDCIIDGRMTMMQEEFKSNVEEEA